jgi:hypothetical protein
MLLIKELAAACPNTDLLRCRVVDVSVMWLRSVSNADLCGSHLRHICVFSSESMPWMAHVMMKLPTTSLSLSTWAHFHRNIYIKLTRT